MQQLWLPEADNEPLVVQELCQTVKWKIYRCTACMQLPAFSLCNSNAMLASGGTIYVLSNLQAGMRSVSPSYKYGKHCRTVLMTESRHEWIAAILC